jgi:Ca2+-binding RTX toxin-like protein
VEDVMVALVLCRRCGMVGSFGVAAAVFVAAVFGMLALPSGALAWAPSLRAGTLLVVDAVGADDSITLLDDGSNLRVADDGGPGLQGPAPAGCTADGTDLLCAANAVMAVEVHGGAGDDSIENDSSVGSFTAFGESGDDVLLGGADKDVLDGGDGNDRLIGGDGDDDLSDGAGDDHLSGGAGDDHAGSGSGGDVLDGGAGDDTLGGGADADTLVGGGGADVLDAGAGDDVLDAGAGDDVVSGGDGRDLLQSSQGADALHGEAGDDRLIVSGSDPVTLDGGDGNDMLQGGDGNDRLLGVGGDDRLDGNAGADVLFGGVGTDTVDYGQRVARVFVTIGAGSDDGGAGEHDTVEVDVERVLGGAGNDVLTAGAEPTQLHGGAGDDTLHGGSGSDLLDGGEGDDRLFTRRTPPDSDVLRCGDATDTFVADRRDTVAGDCESGHVDGVAISPPSQLRKRPVVSLGGPVQRIVHVDRRGRIVLGVHCRSQTAGRCDVRLTADALAGRRLRRIASARLTVPGGATRRMRLRISVRTLRVLRRAGASGFNGRVNLTITDAFGRRSKQRVAIRWVLS